jgi:HEAT repeat protein
MKRLRDTLLLLAVLVLAIVAFHSLVRRPPEAAAIEEAIAGTQRDALPDAIAVGIPLAGDQMNAIDTHSSAGTGSQLTAGNFAGAPAPDATASVVQTLRTGTSPEKQNAAAQLAKLGTVSATEALLEELKTETSVQDRRALLAAISGLTSEEAAEPLLECLGESREYDVREAARSGLKNSASPVVLDRLLEALRKRQDDQAFVRDVAKVFRSLDNAELVPALISVIVRAETYTEAEICAEALANIGTPDAASNLVTTATTVSGSRRTVVTRAISHISRTNGVLALAAFDLPGLPPDIQQAITTAGAPFLGRSN